MKCVLHSGQTGAWAAQGQRQEETSYQETAQCFYAVHEGDIARWQVAVLTRLVLQEMRPKVVAECTLKESAAINQILGRKVTHCRSVVRQLLIPYQFLGQLFRASVTAHS